MCFFIENSLSKMRPRLRTLREESMTSFPTCSVRSMFAIFFRLALILNQITSVFNELNWRGLDEHHTWMASMNCFSRSMVHPMRMQWRLSQYTPCSPQQLPVISVLVMTEMGSVNESYQLIRTGSEFVESQNSNLRYNADHSVETADHHGGTAVFDRWGRSSTRLKPGVRQNGMSAHLITYPLYWKPNSGQDAPGHALRQSWSLAW